MLTTTNNKDVPNNRSTYYINPVSLLEELKKSKSLGVPTEALYAMFILLSVKVNTRMRYRDPADRQDCESGSLMDLIQYWNRIDLSRCEDNPPMAFAYLTQIAKRGSAKAFNILYPNNEHGVKVLHMGNIFHDNNNI